MSIQGKTIVFTGKISKPRHEFQRLVEEHGGIAGSDVSPHTDYLVVGEKPGSKLFRATMLNILTITEQDFIKLLEEEPEKEEEIPLFPKELAELESHRVTLVCNLCKKEYKQWDSIPNSHTCPVCEILSPNLGPCGTGPNSICHFWFRKTIKENRDVIEDCLCGATLITHPDGTWEKHEPRHIIEQARKIAHQHAVEERRLCYQKQEEEKKKEIEIIKFIESLTPEQREELRRQNNANNQL